MFAEIFTVDKKNASAECAHKSMKFPQANTWDELFEAPHGRNYTAGCVTISETAYINRKGVSRFWVPARLRPEVLEALNFIVPDHAYVEVIDRGDGSALVTVQHNKIISSRWVSLIDLETVPKAPTSN